MRPRFLGVLVAAMALSFSAGAHAQPAAGDAEKQGKAKFDEARAVLDKGRVKEALALFQESWALNKSVGTMLNIANCEEQLGLPASAWKHYQEALGLLPATDKRIPRVKELVASVEGHVPKLRIRLEEGAPKGTKVMLADKEVAPGEMDAGMALDPGKYVIKVVADGFATRTYDIALEDGEKVTAAVAPGAVVPVEERIGTGGRAPSEPPNEKRGFPTRTVVIAGGGALAGVAAVMGAVFTVTADGKIADVEKARKRLSAGECAGGTPSAACGTLTSLVEERNTLATASLWSFVGAVALGVGTGAYVLWGPKESGAKPAAVRARMVASPLGGHVVVEGVW